MQSENHARAETANRLVREGRAGAHGKEIKDKVVTPSATAVGESEEFVSRGPFSGCDGQESDFSTLVPFDGGSQFVEIRNSRSFAGVVRTSV